MKAVRTGTLERKRTVRHPGVARHNDAALLAGRRHTRRRGVLAAALLALAPLPTLHAQDSGRSWNASSEFSFVRTAGNAASSTFGLAGTVTRAWDRTEVKVEAGGIRTRSTRVRRTAVGTQSDYSLDEASESSLSAENYNALLRVDRRFSSRTSVYVQSGWKRNTFSGFKHRVINVFGVSTRWVRNARQRFRTAYGLTHTVQRDVVPNPDAAGRFVGLRLSSEYWRKMTDNTEWRSNLVLDGNGDDTSDVRADWTNSVSVAMNQHLGLKTSLRTTFDNEPALRRVPLQSPEGERAGTVLVPRDELDRVFTIALVVTF